MAETGVVLDTHALVWYLKKDARLSKLAEAAVDDALAGGFPVHVPSIFIVELVYLVNKGRIPPEVAVAVDRVLDTPKFGFRVAPLDRETARAVRMVSRTDVPDLPDRVIASTALSLELPLVSRDGKIRVSAVRTIW